MKNKKFLSVLLCLALLASLPVLPGGAAAADDAPDNGMKISKTATANGDGTYTITLEAYATGSKIISEVTKDVPTDIILVLDQSGSMEDPIGGYKYTAYQKYNGNNYDNNEYYPLRHNGGSKNLWYKLDDDKYVAVSVVQESDYQPISGWTNTNYYKNRSNLYCLIDGEYKTVTVDFNISGWTINYTYKVDGKQIGSGSERNGTPKFDDGYAPLYQSVKKYTYSYTLNGVTTVIEESVGDGSSPNKQFYEKGDYSSSAGGTRLNALKNAATTFVNAVAAKAAGADDTIGTNDDVNHRIAVVGFASKSGYGNNTELLSIAGSNSGSVGVAYNSIQEQNLKDVMQRMDTSAGQTMVTNAINALAAEGATRTDLGVEMAKRILDKNPVETDEKRNRVVIVFTDGVPTSSSYYDSNVASDAINNADSIKDAKATVYTIGIFSGADATSAGNQNGDETQQANWFMQQVSSNNGTPQSPSYYLSAGDSGALNNIFKQISDQIETGGSSSTLTETSVVKDIISPQFTLPAGATASDITLETWKCTGKDGDAYTWSKNTDAMGAQATITSTDNTHATTTNNQVSVTGFNFSENYVGTVTENGNTTYRGNKLVIKFNVKPRDGFLGGNGVYTNTSAGVYENASATEPVLTFDRPQTDVTIKEPTITLPDANVYLGAYFDETVSADDLKNGTSISFDNGKITLDLSKEDDKEKPWGLEPWQTEYVDITVTVKDKDGNPVTDFENLREDTDYTVSVSIQPKATGTQTGYNKPQSGTIHVFTPELTFKDNTVDYQSSLDGYAYAEKDYVGTRWRHQDAGDANVRYSTDDGVTMLGSQTAPELTLGYVPTAGVDTKNIVTATDHVPVKVTVEIGTEDVTRYTTFVHQACTDEALNCQWDTVTKIGNGNPAFLLHVINVVGDLTITKTGLNQHTYTGEKEDQESAIFKVEGDNQTWYVAINANANGTGSVTLTGLKVGNYTVTELTGWTWRYGSSTLTSDDQNTDGTFKVNGGQTTTVTCANSNHNDKWLGGDNYANNVFAGSNTPATD